MKLIGKILALGSMATLGVAQMPGQAEHNAPVAASESIPNLGILLARVNALKTELRQYYACSCTCGCYAKDLDLEADRAIKFLRARGARRTGDERPAMVLDIDETTLSNWPEMEAANFEYDGKGFHAWVESAQAPVIPGTLRLYREARKLGIAVFFLTGRPDTERAATETNLRLRGFDGWQQLVMRSEDQKTETAQVFKAGERRKIVTEGYRIVVNVGDQWSDLRGTPEAEYSVKYPDPFYSIK